MSLSRRLTVAARFFWFLRGFLARKHALSTISISEPGVPLYGATVALTSYADSKRKRAAATPAGNP